MSRVSVFWGYCESLNFPFEDKLQLFPGLWEGGEKKPFILFHLVELTKYCFIAYSSNENTSKNEHIWGFCFLVSYINRKYFYHFFISLYTVRQLLYVLCILANCVNCISDCSESYQIIWDFFTQIRSSIAATILWKQILGGRRQYKKTKIFNKEWYKTNTNLRRIYMSWQTFLKKFWVLKIVKKNIVKLPLWILLFENMKR